MRLALPDHRPEECEDKGTGQSGWVGGKGRGLSRAKEEGLCPPQVLTCHLKEQEPGQAGRKGLGVP